MSGDRDQGGAMSAGKNVKGATEIDPKLLDYLSIGHHCVLWGEGRQNKADCQSYEGT